MDPYIFNTVRRFISEWPEGQDPCSFFVTGGGFSVLDIGKWPGASKVLADAVVAYHMLEEIAFLKGNCTSEEIGEVVNGNVGFVTPAMTYNYARVMQARHADTMPNNAICVVNASMTTNRYRKGVNEAFFALINRPCDEKDGIIRLFRYDMLKLSEAEYNDRTDNQIGRHRISEDERVAQVAMGLLLEEPQLVTLIQQGEQVVSIDYQPSEANRMLGKTSDGDVWTLRPPKEDE